MLVSSIVFYTLATLILLSSIMVISSRSSIISSLFLVFNLFLLACVYATMNAHFVAAIQILVFAGAILMLFLFVIMLLNTEKDEQKAEKTSEASKVLITLFCLLAISIFAIVSYLLSGINTPIDITGKDNNTAEVATLLFSKHILAFELASFLILLAIIASIIIAKKPKTGDTREC